MKFIKRRIKKAINNPSLVVSSFEKKIINFLTDKGYKFSQGYSFPPRFILFSLTNVCNVRCLMCRRWQIDTIFNLEKNPGQYISIEAFRRTIDELALWKPDVLLSGGEPLLHKDIVDIVEYTNRKRMTCSLETNGVFLDKKAESLIKAGINSICVSIDGPSEVHDKIRGVLGTFERAVKGIRKALDIKNSQGLSNLHIYINCTMSQLNLNDCYDLVRIAQELQVDINFSQLWFMTDDMIDRHNGLFGGELHVKHQDVNYLDPAKIDVRYMADILEEIQDTKGVRVTISPIFNRDEIHTYYNEPSVFIKGKKCLSPWKTGTILCDGTVIFCLNNIDYKVGNIEEESFFAIWNNDKSRWFRKRLLQNKIFPVCSRCCSIFKN